MAISTDWLEKLARLRVDRARGDYAPHKPLLLLILCDLAEVGQLNTSTLALTPELASRFISYWSIVVHRRTQKPDIRLPFHHLSGDGVWSALDADAKPSPGRRHTRFAALPPDLLCFLKDPASRDMARHLLIAKYFRPSEQIALYESIGLRVPSTIEIEQNAAYRSPKEAKLAGREARFRVRVLAACDYTCALTGYRLTTITGASVVDAARIHQFADSRNNDISNGIALSKNAHWLFDQGLWTVSDDFRVIVAVGAFSESAEDSVLLLQSRHGTTIHLPNDQSLRPSPVHLGWHRRKKFQQP